MKRQDYMTCKICGKKYSRCESKQSDFGEYRWYDVACCPEHGEEYLQEILRSRNELPPEAMAQLEADYEEEQREAERLEKERATKKKK